MLAGKRYGQGDFRLPRLDFALRRRVRRTGPIEISENHVPLTRWPEEFSDFRIVQLTDIHHGLFLPLEEVERAVELANRLRPDLVALTGDFVSFSRNYIRPVAELLGRLEARHGVFAVLGNHDHRVGAELVARALERHGAQVLNNRNLAIRRNGSAFYLAGIDDMTYRRDDLPRALRSIPRGAARLLLSHNPRILRWAAALGVDLVLSGHTHGGQVLTPTLRAFYDRSGWFPRGWGQLGETRLYVSRGIGMTVVPIRIGCPAEIPLFRLRPSTGHHGGDHAHDPASPHTHRQASSGLARE